jgi:hypothetical protein
VQKLSARVNIELQYLRVYESKSGGCVDLHPFHGADELPENMEACRILADHGYHVQLLPSIPEAEVILRKQLLPDVFLNKNPDIRINGLWVGDIKTPDKDTFVKKSTVNRSIYSAAQQKVDLVVVNLYERDYTVQDVKKGVVGALQPDRNKSIKQVWLITKNRNLFIVKREMVFNDAVYEVLTHL